MIDAESWTIVLKINIFLNFHSMKLLTFLSPRERLNVWDVDIQGTSNRPFRFRKRLIHGSNTYAKNCMRVRVFLLSYPQQYMWNGYLKTVHWMLQERRNFFSCRQWQSIGTRKFEIRLHVLVSEWNFWHCL